MLEFRAFADIDHQGGALDFGRLDCQFGKSRNELDRQVVDAVVAEVLESLKGGGFARAAHPGDDDQLRRGAAIVGNRRLLGFSFESLSNSAQPHV